MLNVSGAGLIKKQLSIGSTLNGINDYITFLFKPLVILGFVFVFLSALVMFKALSLAKFSAIIPIATGINFALTVLVGVFIFGDKLNFYSYIGLLLIIVGILLISLTNNSNSNAI